MRRQVIALLLGIGVGAGALACTPTKAPPPADDVAQASAPALAPAKIVIVAEAPGFDAHSVERLVTAPLEEALAGLPGLDRIESASRPDAATITLTLTRGAHIEQARAEALQRLAGAQRSLPEGIDVALGPDVAADAPALRFVVRADAIDPIALHRRLGALTRAIQATPGVATVELCGDRHEQVEIRVVPDAQRALGVATRSLETALREALGLGGARASLEDIGSVVVPTAGPSPILVRDLATIAQEAAPPTCEARALDGAAIVVGAIWPLRGAQAAEVEGTLRALLHEERSAGIPLELIDADAPTILLEVAADEDPGASLAALTPRLADALGDRPASATLEAPRPRDAGAPLEITLRLPPGSDAAALASVEERLARTPGVVLRDIIAPGAPPRLRLRVLDDDLERGRQIAERAASVAAALPGVRSARTRAPLAPTLSIKLDRERLAALGLPANAATRALTLAHGTPVGALLDGDERVEVILGVGPADPGKLRRPEALASLPIPLADGGAVDLAAVAEIRLEATPSEITRSDLRRAIDVELRLADEGARAAVERAIASDVELPPGVLVVFD